MTRSLAVSLALIAADVVLVAVFAAARHPTAGALFLAVLASAGVGAAVQRLRSGPDQGWRARLHPLVVAASLAAFDLVLAAATLMAADR